MKIIIDDKIPYIQGALEPFAEVIYLPGAKITAQDVKDADAIITRTRTKCNESLLKDSSVKFIATATIGYDHIDTAYCESNGIKWTNAPGCNSGSVQQYIGSALAYLANEYNLSFTDTCLGVVGVGNVGKKVAALAEAIGMKVLLNDPPRERKEGGDGFVSIEQIKQEADIITFHVPLNREGEDKTFHMVDDEFIDSLPEGKILINSSRGEVIRNDSLKMALQKGKLKGTVIDVWEDEPDIDLELLSLVSIATPHIAGYSKDGKANGTSMSVQALSKHFGLGIDNWQAQDIEQPSQPVITIHEADKQMALILALNHTYNIKNDDALLRNTPSDFEKQRGDYLVRREYGAYEVRMKDEIAKEVLEEIGFVLIK